MRLGSVMVLVAVGLAAMGAAIAAFALNGFGSYDWKRCVRDEMRGTPADMGPTVVRVCWERYEPPFKGEDYDWKQCRSEALMGLPTSMTKMAAQMCWERYEVPRLEREQNKAGSTSTNGG